MILPMSHAQSDDQFGSGRSQHCTYFSTCWCEPMKNLKAADLSTVRTFPFFECEAMKNLAAVDLSTVHTFLLLSEKKLLSPIKFLIRNPGSRAGPLRGAATNLRTADLSTVRTFPSFAAKR